MLIDDVLPNYDATQVCEIEVDASASETWDAIREADLRDRFIDLLFTIRELPNRLIRRLHGEPAPAMRGPVTFDSIVNEGPGFTPLAEDDGVEFVVGSVGRFWRKDYGARPVSPEAFATFAEPGYARLAISFRVVPIGEERARLRYEARTAATDDAARWKFDRYWKVIRRGVALVMRRALVHIKQEAERRHEEAVCHAS